MDVVVPVDMSKPSRELIRHLRVGVRRPEEVGVLPESVAWHLYLELRRRGEPNAGELFVRALRNLHSRRSFAGSTLPSDDTLPNEHRMSEDAYLADLWKAYKKCIRMHRTGPASQLLRDIEEQVL
jgi:hypothetical protein